MRWMYLGRNITHEFLLSQSVSVLSSFKCCYPHWCWCCSKKTWRNNISFKKETEKIMLLQLKGLIQIIVKFRTEKNICAHFCHPHQTQTSSWMSWGTRQILCTKYCVACSSLKTTELIVYISLKESKLACFTNS